MFAEVGLHLENRITVCPTVLGPSTGRETSRWEGDGGREEGLEDYETAMHLHTARAGGFSSSLARGVPDML